MFSSVFVLRLLINHFARLKFVFYSFQFLFCSYQQTNSRCLQLFIKLFYFFFQAVMFFFHQLIKYRIASKLMIINNKITIKNRQFENTVIIVKWCRDVKNDETRIEKLKVVKDFVLKQQKMLKNFAAKFMQHIQHDLQFSTIIKHEFEWQNFIIITFNAQQRQKKLTDSICIMKQYWSVESVNALMTNIKSRHIEKKTVKLTKKYFNDYEKTVKLMQQTILQKKKQIYRKVKIIANYTFIDFKNVFSKNYQNQILFIFAVLKNVDLKQED